MLGLTTATLLFAAAIDMRKGKVGDVV